MAGGEVALAGGEEADDDEDEDMAMGSKDTVSSFSLSPELFRDLTGDPEGVNSPSLSFEVTRNKWGRADDEEEDGEGEEETPT